MILSILLTIVFVFMAIYSIVFIHRIGVRYVLLLAYCSAIFFTWNPESSTVIANLFGIGRGLDFILVLLSVTIVNGMYFVIRHLNDQHQDITKLAQYIAIRDARHPIQLDLTIGKGIRSK